MKILNIVDYDKSQIKFKINNYPDGQKQVIILDKPFDYCIDGWAIQEEVQIRSRLNNFQDLELIICATKSLQSLGVKEIHLYTPYFLGSRSDRKFEEGSNSYLKDVICPIINSLNFKSVTVLDPHSYILEACLNNFKKEDNTKLVLFAQNNIYSKRNDFNHHSILVSPDAGASHKIYKLAEEIGYKGDIITCSKERASSGKLIRVDVPLNAHKHENKDLIIVDDICDGGGTFINIAKEIIRQTAPWINKPKIYLVVTHGIFSKGFTELNKYFNGIYTTNSYADHPNRVSSQDPILVKQLNIF